MQLQDPLERFGCLSVPTLRGRPSATACGRETWPRGQASRCALPLRRVPRLAQGQDCWLARAHQKTVALVRAAL